MMDNDATNDTHQELDQDVQQILQEHAETQTTEEVPAEQQSTAPVEQEPEYEINWNGQLKKLPISKIQKYAQQGYDYNVKQAELKKQQESLKPYLELDQWAKQNPDKWLQIEQLVRQGSTVADATAQVEAESTNQSVPPEIVETLQELKQFKESIIQERQQMQIQAEDQQLDTQISEIKKQFPQIDFTSLDENGRNLEMRVLEHAANKGIRDFEAAFLHYNKEALQRLHAERGKEELARERMKTTKLGLLGSSPKGRVELSPTTNSRDKSYESLAEEALQELGIR